MEAERRTKKCSACGGETGFVRDVHLKNDLPFSPDYFDAALYRCPVCGQVGKSERCIYCGMSCVPVKGTGAPQTEKAPEPEKKKRRWFRRDDDKPDWEG